MDFVKVSGQLRNRIRPPQVYNYQQNKDGDFFKACAASCFRCGTASQYLNRIFVKHTCYANTSYVKYAGELSKFIMQHVFLTRKRKQLMWLSFFTLQETKSTLSHQDACQLSPRLRPGELDPHRGPRQLSQRPLTCVSRPNVLSRKADTSQIIRCLAPSADCQLYHRAAGSLRDAAQHVAAHSHI